MTDIYKNGTKKTWGKSLLRYCPIKQEVWQYKYNSNTMNNEIIVYKNMPSYGLEKIPIPEDCIIKRA